MGPGLACRHVGGMPFAVFMNFEPDPTGPRGAELLQNCHRMLPGDPRGLGITKGFVGLSEGDEAAALVETLTELSVYAHSRRAARRGSPLAPEIAVSVPEGVV